MKLVSNYNHIITFQNGFSSREAEKFCCENKLDYMFFPTPPEIDSMCGWCVGFNSKEMLLKCKTLLPKNINQESIYYRGENKIWVKM